MYDPFSTRPNPSGSGNIRDAFAGNMIPSSRFDPVAVKVAKFYPAANTAPTLLSNNQANFAATGSKPLDTTQSDYKVDQVLTPTQRFFARYSTRLNDDKATKFFPGDLFAAQGAINQEDHVHGAVADYTNALSSTTVLNARLGFARTLYIYSNQSLGFAPSTLGFSPAIDAAVDRFLFPGFSVSDYRSLGGGDHRANAFMTYTGEIGRAHV